MAPPGGPSPPPPRAAATNGPLEALEGIVERIVFSSEESGWAVVRLAPAPGGLVTAVGRLPGVRPGEHLRLTGAWTVDRRFGRQFRVESFVTLQPSTLTGIRKYLASGLVPGIGPEMAARLTARFGLETLEVIERDPGRLTEVPGIGQKRAAGIVAAWREQRAVKAVMIFLQSHGISTAYALRIYRHFGDAAVGVVKDNPYRLATEISGIGFRSADAVAASLGIARDAPRRIEAGLLHVLGEFAGEGSVCAPRGELVERAAALLEVDRERAAGALERLSGRAAVRIETLAGETVVYLPALHEAEAGAACRLAALLERPPAAAPADAEAGLAWFEEHAEIRLASRQREAVRRALTAPVLVVTGGPGTGKTTIVNAVVRILERAGDRILLAAPTGRAARRLAGTARREARTIHRLLEFNPRKGVFERGEGRPLAAELLVVDEASMVDVVLFDRLLRAVPDGCRLVLVGDADQLPSVGPGTVLRDLVGSGRVAVVSLTEIFRQARRSRIVLSAHRVNRGELPVGMEPAGEGAPPGTAEDFYFVERNDPERILETVTDLAARRIPRRFGLDPMEDVQVLTPMHRGILGAENLNRELQRLLNPAGEALERGGFSFRRGDKVMQTRNNYDLDVFNGDLGRITAVDVEEREVTVRFDGREVVCGPAELDDLVLGYASSIHKAQGSEYPAVVIPLHTQHYVLLQRNLLYTAITRGRRLVVLVGMRRAVARAVRTSGGAARYGHLAARLGEPPVRQHQ